MGGEALQINRHLNTKKTTEVEGINILKTYGWVRGIKLRSTYRCNTLGRVGGSVISMLTDAYGVCAWVVCNFQMLTDAYGGYGWVGRKYLNAYGCLRGGGWMGF